MARVVGLSGAEGLVSQMDPISLTFFDIGLPPTFCPLLPCSYNTVCQAYLFSFCGMSALTDPT